MKINSLFFSSVFLVFCSMQSDSVIWVQKAYFGGGQRREAVSFTINGIGYVGTGKNESNLGYLRSFYKYDPTIDVWNRIESLPSTTDARKRAIGFSIGDKGYVCGGEKRILIGTDFDLNDFWEYNPATNLWFQRKDFPRGITEGTGFSIGNKGYVGLGLGRAGCGETNTFYEYDPSTNMWKQLKDFPGAPRRNAVGFSHNGKGYVGLGYDYQNYGYVYFNDLWEYNPSDDSWNRLSDFPGNERKTAIGFGIDNNLYLGMGLPNDFYKFDLITKDWEFLNYLPGTARGYAYSFCINKTIYYGGGWDHNYNVFSDLWSYEVIGNTGIENNITDNNLKIFPIPTNGVLRIEQIDKAVIDEIKILDMSSKILRTFTNVNSSIDISDLNEGAYIISIISEDKELHKQKIFKK